MSFSDNDIMNQFKEDVSKIETQGGLPDDGEYVAQVTGLNLNPKTVMGNKGATVPVTYASFSYKLVDDPLSPTDGRAFRGSLFSIIKASDIDTAFEGGQKQSKEISKQQFIGALAAITGEKPTDLGTSMLQAKELFASATPPVVKLRVSTRKYPKKDGTTGSDTSERIITRVS
jgi:hypothetical protein